MKKFERVIGYTSIVKELTKLSDIVSNPEKYKSFGVKTPSGILLYGEPGVGKTLLATSFVEACGIKSYICRKDKPNDLFVEEIKNKYIEASKNAPAIVFLDDIDKFANEDEYHQNTDEYITVQSCIDEYKDKGVFTIATANEIDNLPDTLKRAGRFDINLKIFPPLGEDAVNIVTHYLSNKNVSSDVDKTIVARILNGESCATLESVINEAGICSVFNNKKEIEMEDIIEAWLRIIGHSPEEMSSSRQKYKDRIAYHEAGHAVIYEVLMSKSVNLISIRKCCIDIGGITSFSRPEGYEYIKKFRDYSIMAMLGGMASTEIVFGDADLGSSQDLEKVSRMIGRLIKDCAIDGFLCLTDSLSESKFAIDKKAKLQMFECEKYYKMAKKILIENREFLDKIAHELMEKETILQSDIKRIKESCTIKNFEF